MGEELDCKGQSEILEVVELFYAFIWGSGYMTVRVCEDSSSTLKRIHFMVCKVYLNLIFKRSKITIIYSFQYNV